MDFRPSGTYLILGPFPLVVEVFFPGGFIVPDAGRDVLPPLVGWLAGLEPLPDPGAASIPSSPDSGGSALLSIVPAIVFEPAIMLLKTSNEHFTACNVSSGQLELFAVLFCLIEGNTGKVPGVVFQAKAWPLELEL